ncbi:NUDIX domain-containing protein [Streptomyces sp. SID8367]|nr:NUDIX domain-containing protein [Streptomyces sp. SID8367]
MSLNLPSLIAGAVIAHAGEALLIQRAVPERDLLWQFPAGKVDPGETVLKAAAREALEEAGVVVEPLSVIGERVHPVTARRVVYVACRWLSGAARPASPREVAAVAWVPFVDLDRYIPGGVFEPVRDYLTGPALPF